MFVLKAHYSSEKIKERLELGLPGAEAQWRMAPAGRSSTQNIDSRKAAVLIPLLLDIESPSVILIQRTEYLGVHSGQFAFPGGKFDEGEDNPSKVALREAEEEIGLRSEHCSILGKLSSMYIPVSRMHVFPVVGSISSATNLTRNEREVQAIHTIPLAHFFISENIGIFEPPTIHRSVPGFRLESGILWGATAMMLSELLEVLEPELWRQLSQGNFDDYKQ
jgi:8-oxo-dGTP pyrophosphatase MutT (NUDIX family)